MFQFSDFQWWFLTITSAIQFFLSNLAAFVSLFISEWWR